MATRGSIRKELESRCENDGRCAFLSDTGEYCVPCFAAWLLDAKDRQVIELNREIAYLATMADYDI